MKYKLKTWFRNFKPPLFITCFFAVVFCGASLYIVINDTAPLLDALTYGIYVCAALSLSFAVWAVVYAVSGSNIKERFLNYKGRVPLAGKLIDDYAFRTVTAASVSFGINALFAVSKGIAGWITGSLWLIAFTAYYLVLCVVKLFLLRSSKRLQDISDEKIRYCQEWKSYRLCGIFLMALTVVLQGVVVLIVKEGNHFTYYGVLIFAVALYDFYCLSASIFYMIKTRKKHSPIIVAIKSTNLAKSLVSILSLQTAMFASFGSDEQMAMQDFMNLMTGSVVCVILLILGCVMVVHGGRKLKVPPIRVL